jgi:hypothetical protein
MNEQHNALLEWGWLTILLPVLIGIFKQEIGEIIFAYQSYSKRSFDADGNPNTPDAVQILNEATGDWERATIKKWVFSLDSTKRGIYLLWPCRNGAVAAERLSFQKWKAMRKRHLPTVASSGSSGSSQYQA